MTTPIYNKGATIASPLVNLPSIDSVGKDSLQTLRQALAAFSPQARTQWANSQNEKGLTPLAIAVEAHSPALNKMEIIAFLIKECGANPDIGDNDNWTPLYRASTGTRSDVLQFLINHKANLNIPNKDGSTPLHRSTDRGCEGDVKTLLLHGAEVNVVNCFGTPLAYAAKNGNILIARILLDAGADPNLVNDPLASTPLELAANNHKEEMRLFLLSRNGQAVIPIDSKIHTSLSKLVQMGDESAILQNFIQGERDEYGRSAAHYCAHFGKLELIKQMNAQGNMDIGDNKGRTPLHYAIIRGHELMVSSMIGEEGQCALASQDHQGYTPLMWACQYNQERIAKILLERAKEKNILEAILGIGDHFGWKAIHKAAQVGNLTLVRMLVEEYKVDPYQLTNNGRSPLDLAKITHASEVIIYLKPNLRP